MVALRHARGILDGAGVTGLLLAAALVAFSLTGVCPACDGWPAAPTSCPEPALIVAPAAHESRPPALSPATPRPATATAPGARGGALGVGHTEGSQATPVDRRRTTSHLPLTP